LVGCAQVCSACTTVSARMIFRPRGPSSTATSPARSRGRRAPTRGCATDRRARVRRARCDFTQWLSTHC
jgi:hypothetical protein